MPTTMCQIGTNHALVLDTKTDKSHLVERNKPTDYLFTFDANGNGYPPSGEYVCRLRHRDRNLVLTTELGIVVDPVPLSRPDCFFEMEERFLEQWLVLQYEGAAP